MNWLNVLELETVIEEKNELSMKDIRLNGTGGTDVCGEWNWNGDYECSIFRNFSSSNYDFYGRINRRRSKAGNTVGWSVTIYLSIFYSNGSDIKVLEGKYKTLKAVKVAILEKVKELHTNEESTLKLINEWKSNHARPVFALSKETGKPMLIGTAYISVGNEMYKDKEKLWFNDDVPDYDNYSTVYDLQLSYYQDVHFYANKTEGHYGGYSHSTEKDVELIQQMLNLVKGNEKYSWLFKRYEEYLTK